jgi:hypothetical protein
LLWLISEALFIHSGNAKHWLRQNLLSRRYAASKGGESLAMEDRNVFYLRQKAAGRQWLSKSTSGLQ